MSEFRKPTPAELANLNPERALLWYDYADAWLGFELKRVLDYGCGYGEFLQRLKSHATSRTGVDIDEEKIKVASTLDGIQAQLVPSDEALPFPDESFDTVIIMEVIEHVSDERVVLAELARVLAPGGHLLLTTPHKGLLTFIDPGNMKYVTPRLHRFIHRTLLRQKDYYERRFGQARLDEKGMVADFTTDQDPWHRHYRFKTIESVAPESLSVVAWSSYYPAFRALWTLRLALKVLSFGWIKRLPWPFSAINRKLSRVESGAGDQLVVLFQKKR